MIILYAYGLSALALVLTLIGFFIHHLYDAFNLFFWTLTQKRKSENHVQQKERKREKEKELIRM